MSTKEWIKEELMPTVDYLWIVPSTIDLKDGDYQELSRNFTFIDLKQNFRNSRHVVRAAKAVADEKSYDYKEGIAMPLGRFPSGCEPQFVDSFKKATREARKRTNEGILVIIDNGDDALNVKDYFEVLDELNENRKTYHRGRNDFEKGGSPYKFLLDGNVLIIGQRTSFGFDWPTVILVERRRGHGAAYHVCNFMLRCTTDLIVVTKKVL